MDWESSPSSSSSSSSSRPVWQYDVFLCFRPIDTGNSFSGHLLAALKRKGIKTFTEDQAEKGGHLAPEILRAIEESRIYIVVFSRNFASSTWCLEDIQKFVERVDSVPEHTIFPVFYDVDPSDVRKQRGVYWDAFAELERGFKDNLYRVERWRQVMTEVANLQGYDARNKPESKVIDNIVKDTIRKLGHNLSSLADDLVGMPPRLEALENLLDLDSNDVVQVGICGMPGIGKTTLASVVYDKISHQFDTCCFLSNVSEVSKRHHGLSHLQEKLIRHTLELEDLKIRDGPEGTILLRTRLKHLRILLVLDDVDHSEQIEKLANVDCVGRGSRIIIITRDEHILKRFGVGKDKIYKVEPLNEEESLQLLCRKAFRCDYPMEGCEELIGSILNYANGLPLAFKSLDLSLLKQSDSHRRSAMTELQTIHSHFIMKQLRKSFDGLPNLEKEIFLDIACFFVGEKINYVKEILKHYRFDPEIRIQALVEKLLVTISDQRIYMHDMLQEMGREIVRQESPDEPERWSRLWFYKDFGHLTELNTAITNVEAIVLNQEEWEDLEETPLDAKAISKMVRLKLLMIRNVKFFGSLDYLSKSLAYVSWHKYPFTCLPSSFEPHRLAELIMPDSNITQLWEGIKVLPNLKNMNLRDSKDLIKMPNFRGLINLERLDLEGCTALLHIDQSIVVLAKLTFLNLRNCTSLVSIPNNLFGLNSIEILNLAGCTKLERCFNCFQYVRSTLEMKLLSNQFLSFFSKLMYCIVIFFLGRQNQ